MRNLCIALTLLFVSICASAQSHKQLDSLSFILPEFGQGSVVYADKHFSRGEINISPLDQMVYCITAERDTLTATDNASIISVTVDGRSFLRWKDSFVENIVTNGDTGIGIIRSTTKVNNVKTGAYGMVDNSSAIDSYTYDSMTGSFKENIIDNPQNYMYKRSPCLYKDGKYYTVSKKSFERLFPDKKAYIESVWADRKVSASDVDSVIAFYNELLQQ